MIAEATPVMGISIGFFAAMRLGIKATVSLIATLCDLHAARGRLLVVNSWVVDQLNLPPISDEQRWESVVARLQKLDVVSVRQDPDALSGPSRSLLFWKRENTLRNESTISKLIAVLQNPDKYFDRYSVTRQAPTLAADRQALRDEFETISTAISVAFAPRKGDLSQCLAKLQEFASELDLLEQKTQSSIGLVEKCEDIQRAAGWPGDYDDRVWGTYKLSVDLLAELEALGYPRTRAQEVILQHAPAAQFSLRRY